MVPIHSLRKKMKFLCDVGRYFSRFHFFFSSFPFFPVFFFIRFRLRRGFGFRFRFRFDSCSPCCLSFSFSFSFRFCFYFSFRFCFYFSFRFCFYFSFCFSFRFCLFFLSPSAVGVDMERYSCASLFRKADCASEFMRFHLMTFHLIEGFF